MLYLTIIVILIGFIIFYFNSPTNKMSNNSDYENKTYDCGYVWEMKDPVSQMFGRKAIKCKDPSLSRAYSYKNSMEGTKPYTEDLPDWDQENALLGEGNTNGYSTVDPKFKVGFEPKRKIFELTYSDDLKPSEQLVGRF